MEVAPPQNLSNFSCGAFGMSGDWHGCMDPTSKDSICGDITAPKNLSNFSLAAFGLCSDRHGRMDPTSKDSTCGDITAPKPREFFLSYLWLVW